MEVRLRSTTKYPSQWTDPGPWAAEGEGVTMVAEDGDASHGPEVRVTQI